MTTKDQLETLIVTHTKEMARALLAEHGYSMRFASVDGEGCVVTCEYNPSRVNVDVVDNKVVSIDSIG